MARVKSTNHRRIEAFDLAPGRVVAGKYVVDAKLGAGWEGEVYRVVETRTGVHRALKLFYPHRNPRDRAVTFYAKKLERLRDCAIVIQYVHTETIRTHGQPVTCLVSEYVDGEIMKEFIRRRAGGRLPPFEALHLLHSLARGIEQIHNVKEYHGDLHDRNVLINRRGVFFDVKVLDFYHWGAPTARHLRHDVADLVRLLYDAVGGKARYASQPAEIKSICRGLRRDLIARAFPTAKHLRMYLETFAWDSV
jgi:RIO-like serine/threonine protein kinase